MEKATINKANVYWASTTSPEFWAMLCRSLQLMGTTATGDGVGKGLIELFVLQEGQIWAWVSFLALSP